ncbi:MAG: hypothetical protein WD025_02550 [Bacteriovoracaceae bacterium]
MKNFFAIWTLLSLAPIFATSAIHDESDLSGGLNSPLEEAAGFDFFRADKVEHEKIETGRIGLRVILNTKEGTQKTLKGFTHRFYFAGKFHNLKSEKEIIRVEACAKNSAKAVNVATLVEHPLFTIENHKGEPYEILFKLKCGQLTTLIFDWDSYGGQALGVRDTALRAVAKFKEIDRLDFWNEKIHIVYRSNGNFYDFEKVHVTDGYKWDIVAHELGHGVYHLARVGRGAAGEHYIDRCYGEGIAFSEGWASFFSAWLRFELNDPAPAFEFMVPRRAPLAIERVPSDVCKGPGNEWRVFAFLWDLIDHNNDDESSRISFQELWDFSRGKEYTGLSQFKEDLLNSGYDPVLVNLIWDQTVMGNVSFDL